MNKAFDHSKYANWIDPHDVIPYSKNAQKHPAKQVANIAESIKRYGWQQDVVITSDNVLVIGHGRRLAAIRLGCQMPYHMVGKTADDLTEEDIKELRIIDNKVGESDWDLSLLATEIADIDLSAFDLDFQLPQAEISDDDNEDEDEDEDEDVRAAAVKHNVFENYEREQFTEENYYGIPAMQATQTVGDKMARFMDWEEIDDPSLYICHFYYDDYKFIQAWRNPDKYVERLRRFKAVVAPDFSLYTDFPRALQILSCYRRQWTGAYWQSLGIDVIPDVVWGDEKSFDYCFLGIPEGSTVAISTVGVKADKNWNGRQGDLFRSGYAEMMRRLHPTTVIFYGDMIEGLDGHIIHCPSYYAEKRAMLNRQKLSNNAFI